MHLPRGLRTKANGAKPFEDLSRPRVLALRQLLEPLLTMGPTGHLLAHFGGPLADPVLCPPQSEQKHSGTPSANLAALTLCEP